MKKINPITKSPSAKSLGKSMVSKGKTIKEYGGMEKYPSKSAMMKHEKSESKKTEMAEGKSYKAKITKTLVKKTPKK